MASDSANRKKWETENPSSNIPGMDLYAGLDFSTPPPMQPTQGPVPSKSPQTSAPTSIAAAPTTPLGAPSSSGGGNGLPPVASAPPSLAGLQDSSGVSTGMDEGAAPHNLSGPTTGRMNIGNRMPPSLAALIKHRVY